MVGVAGGLRKVRLQLLLANISRDGSVPVERLRHAGGPLAAVALHQALHARVPGLHDFLVLDQLARGALVCIGRRVQELLSAPQGHDGEAPRLLLRAPPRLQSVVVNHGMGVLVLTRMPGVSGAKKKHVG